MRGLGSISLTAIIGLSAAGCVVQETAPIRTATAPIEAATAPSSDLPSITPTVTVISQLDNECKIAASAAESAGNRLTSAAEFAITQDHMTSYNVLSDTIYIDNTSYEFDPVAYSSCRNTVAGYVEDIYKNPSNVFEYDSSLQVFEKLLLRDNMNDFVRVEEYVYIVAPINILDPIQYLSNVSYFVRNIQDAELKAYIFDNTGSPITAIIGSWIQAPYVDKCNGLTEVSNEVSVIPALSFLAATTVAQGGMVNSYEAYKQEMRNNSLPVLKQDVFGNLQANCGSPFIYTLPGSDTSRAPSIRVGGHNRRLPRTRVGARRIWSFD